MTTACITPFSDGLYFDCSVWVPGDEYHDLTSSASDESEYTEEELSEDYGSQDNALEEEVEEDKYVEQLSLNEVLKRKECTKDIGESFKMLKDQSGKASTSSLIQQAQKMGFAPSKEDENNFLEKCGPKASYEEFSEWLVSIAHLEDSIEELIRFFERYDQNKTGKLSRNQVTVILKELGEPLTTEEINYLLKSGNQNSNQVDYRYLAEMLLKNK